VERRMAKRQDARVMEGAAVAVVTG
jgi:hypothetical protein